jgi:hypothetical protein
MLPSIKFQNGAQIQDGRQKMFIVAENGGKNQYGGKKKNPPY